MSIPSADLEPGAVYADGNGQCREIVKLLKHMCQYRLIAHGRENRRDGLQVGGIAWVKRGTFAEWAQREVEDSGWMLIAGDRTGFIGVENQKTAEGSGWDIRRVLRHPDAKDTR